MKTIEIGTLVKHIEYEWYAITTQWHHDNTWLVIRMDNAVCNWYSECELELIG